MTVETQQELNEKAKDEAAEALGPVEARRAELWAKWLSLHDEISKLEEEANETFRLYSDMGEKFLKLTYAAENIDLYTPYEEEHELLANLRSDISGILEETKKY